MSGIGSPDDPVYHNLVSELRKMFVSVGDKYLPMPGTRQQVAEARARLLAYVGAPLSTFRGTIKQVPTTLLNEIAQTVLDTVFPTFSNTVEFDPAQTLEAVKGDLGGRQGEFLDAVAKVLAEKGPRDERQERRYAGDRNMSRGRYFTVCNDPGGDDSQTLCRELFAYIDSAVPGWAFVGDPWDSQLYKTLGGDDLPDVYRRCVYVILLEPLNENEQTVYQHAYSPVLKRLASPHGLKLLPIPVRWYDVEIPHVLDLRRPEAQDWFFHFFRAGDGAILIKPAEPARSFFEMLPAMYHPYRGGSGVTAGIGSWLRVMGVDGLVYPSARSDAAIQVGPEGELITARGWNLVLYSGSEATPDRQIHADSNPWYNFEDAGYKGVVIHREGASWHLSGVEVGYSSTRDLIVAVMEHMNV